MDENLIKRIGDEYLQANHKDGETFLHTDYNEFLSIFKTSINENYYDIQRIIKGTLKVYNTTKLDGATLSRSVNGSLSSDDNTISSSKQVKTYVDNYYNELSKKDEALSTTVSGAVSASNTAIDTANDAAFNASNALDIATQASAQASRADFNADTAMNTATELSRTKADVTEMEKRALITETGNKLSFSVDPSTYVLTIKLLDKLNNVLSTGTVDLPIESLVMNVSYDDETKSITLTLQNGEKVSFSVSALVEGLVSEDTFNQRIEQLKKDLRTELTKTITDDANSSFNQNVKNKTDSFNENSSLKTNEFNNNAAQKTLDYNNNCISKTNSFNQNSTQKLTEFNDNYTSKLNSFNSNADLRMDEYNANADNKIAEYDEHSQELNNKIVDTRNELERVKNDVLETGTDTDTFVHLEDSAMAEMQELSVDGVCEQVTTTGKNLIKSDLLPVTKNGITISKNDNGDIVVNGTITGIESGSVLFDIGNVFTIEKGTYTSSVQNKRDGIGLSTSGFGGLNITMAYNVNFKTATATKAQTITPQINIRYDAGTFNNYIFNPMIEKGSSATHYEPYTGGQPSPSPDYPQEIKTITDSLKITSCGKNLLDKTLIERGKASGYGVSGIIPNKTNNSKRLTLGIENAIKVKPNTTYTLTIPNGFESVIAQLESDLKGLGDTGWVLSNTYTITTKSNAKYVGFNFRKADNSDFTDDDWNNFINGTLQFELGEPTEIEPYQETRVHIDLKGEFIGKINDTYKDTLKVEYNEEDGEYHLVLNKMISKFVLDGSEDWVYYTETNKPLFYIILDNSSHKIDYLQESGLTCYCNYFAGKGQVYKFNDVYDLGNNVIAFRNSYKRLVIRDDRYINTIDFKNWLSTHNTEVYYVLENPYTLDLGVVDIPLSYDEITNIFTDSDLLPKINAKYYRNFITTVQNLQVNEKALKQELIDINNRLSALETATTNVTSESEVTE